MGHMSFILKACQTLKQTERNALNNISVQKIGVMLLSPLLDRPRRIFFSLLLTTFSVLSGASSVKMCWIELGVEDTGHIFGIKLKRKLCFQKENRKLSIHIYPAVKKLSITCISQSVSYSAADIGVISLPDVD